MKKEDKGIKKKEDYLLDFSFSRLSSHLKVTLDLLTNLLEAIDNRHTRYSVQTG